MSKNTGQNKGESTFRRITAIVFVVTALVCIGLFAFASARGELPPVVVAVSLSAIYCAVCVIAYIIFEKKPTRDIPEKLKPIMGRVMFEAVVKMDSPVFICDSEEKLVWFNSATEALIGSGKLFGEKVSDILGVSLSDMRKSSVLSGTHLTVNGRGFGTQYHHIKTDEEDFTLIVTTETTDYDELSKRMQEDELVVGYVSIDNLGEMIQYDTEHYRPAAAKIDEILRAWAEEYGAVLKDYERDKYLLVTQVKELDKMIVQKFDILDRVREVKAGETNLPLTVSMGVSSVGETYAEKEKSAHAALDMALQRGGDQAVVKTDESTEYYGGVMKTVQKRTNVWARVMSNELMNEINSASNVIIMGHKRADFDAFGACVGLARIAMFCGTRVNIVIDKADRNLIGCRTIIAENGDYLGLFITAEEALDLLETDTLVIVADANNLDITEEPELARRAEKLAVIDHHRKTNVFTRDVDVEYIEPSASSACELISEMLEQVLPKDELSSAEANVMLAGITLDTNQFTKNTGTRTFSAAMYLRDRGADPVLVKGMFKESFEDYRREAMFRQNVEIYRGVYAITTVSDNKNGDHLDRTIAAKAADNLLVVDGIKASFALISDGDAVHVSARSSGEINVELIMKKLGGGGHFDGAAAQFENKSVNEVITELKTAIDQRETE